MIEDVLARSDLRKGFLTGFTWGVSIAAVPLGLAAGLAFLTSSLSLLVIALRMLVWVLVGS